MEKYSKKDLRTLVESTGYPMASIEKTLRLLDLLKQFNADEFLADNLVLKGGTAINVIGYGFVDHEKMSADAVTCVSRFLEFSEGEKEYLKAAGEGEYKPELLFDKNISRRIQDNPAAKFYIQSRFQPKVLG